MKRNPEISMHDRDQRRRAVVETGRSFVVEASAGTGKTSTLINRILHLVLENGPEGPPLPLSRICAITFTEKAAGEMKIRLRQHFEQTLSDGQKPAEQLRRASQALDDLETASISTFHSFSVSLLKERPIEAGLDPRFDALDDMRSELFFREVWESWICRALEERNLLLEKALRNGFRQESLQDLARILRLNWLTVRDLKCDPLPTEEQVREKFRNLMKQGQNYLLQNIQSKDKLVRILQRALRWFQQPDDPGNEIAKPGNAGAADNWIGSRETVLAVREFIREAVEFRAFYTSLPNQQLFHELIRWIVEDFMRKEWEVRKKADGLLDFDDQLYFARELLLRHTAVRREFQTRYSVLLVDEFQDTDPIQWEIVLLLSSADVTEKDFSKMQPAPGRLFIVGDPKQSIYRFRNADIETYMGVMEENSLLSLNLDRLRLTTNFRSVPSILDFVDAAFKNIMKPPEDSGRYQPEYFAFGGKRDPGIEFNPPAVSLLGDKNDESGSKFSVKEFIARESKRIARLIRTMCGSESWRIRDAAASVGEAGGHRRLPQYGDIAVLLPVLTHTDILEDAFRDLEIPYVLEGGKFYYTRSEVSSAITVLNAVADPNNGVALYGSLRSVFFGLSDEDLLRAHFNGLPLDYREPVPPESPLHYPFEVLRDLHRYRHQRRASETFEILLQKTGAREVLAVHGLQSLANLNKLGRTLRALQGELAFAQVIDLLGMMDEEGLAESESRLMEERSNAVRIMTIHKAKGLDFPIVFVAGLGVEKRARSKKLLADPRGRGIFALNLGSRDSGLQTPGWNELLEEEKKREDAELIRLLYVALTRARDYLILSTHTAGWKKTDTAERWVLDTEGTRLKPLGPFLGDCCSGSRALARLIDVERLDSAAETRKSVRLPAEKDWCAIADRQYGELRSLLRDTPSARSLRAAGKSEDPLTSEDRPGGEYMPDVVESRSVRLGIAFHEAMERVNLFRGEEVGRTVEELSARYKLDRESSRSLEEMMRVSLSSELLERARTASNSGGKILRELPFVCPLDSATIEEGKIDLLFEESDGWILVDYKTDRVPDDGQKAEDYAMKNYSGQIRAYLEALRTLPIKVSSAYVLLARSGTAVQMM
jgi:ATP-dependent helicase/nuclease subunit A